MLQTHICRFEKVSHDHRLVAWGCPSSWSINGRASEETWRLDLKSRLPDSPRTHSHRQLRFAYTGKSFNLNIEQVWIKCWLGTFWYKTLFSLCNSKYLNFESPVASRDGQKRPLTTTRPATEVILLNGLQTSLPSKTFVADSQECQWSLAISHFLDKLIGSQEILWNCTYFQITKSIRQTQLKEFTSAFRNG